MDLRKVAKPERRTSTRCRARERARECLYGVVPTTMLSIETSAGPAAEVIVMVTAVACDGAAGAGSGAGSATGVGAGAGAGAAAAATAAAAAEPAAVAGAVAGVDADSDFGPPVNTSAAAMATPTSSTT